MHSTIHQPPAFKLSICITTFNRAAFIGATLESILSQLTDDCEIVVLDGASTDGTEGVVSEYTRRCDRLRYIRQQTNNGFDRDCDRVVQLAKGEYCWLMTDDDLLKPGAVAAVLEGLRRDVSLIILVTEVRDLNMQKILQRRWPDFESDRVYGPDEMDRLFTEVGGVLNCNAYVIKREIWLARERERYYDSVHIHIGVIFQKRLPGNVLVIAKPFIGYRRGNAHTYSTVFGELVWARLPAVVESLAISESVRRKVHVAEPWRHFHLLLLRKGQGYYSLTEYRRWIRPRLHSASEALIPLLVALLPGALVNALLVLYYSVTRRGYSFWESDMTLHQMRESPFHFRNWLALKRES